MNTLRCHSALYRSSRVYSAVPTRWPLELLGSRGTPVQVRGIKVLELNLRGFFSCILQHKESGYEPEARFQKEVGKKVPEGSDEDQAGECCTPDEGGIRL